MLVEVKAEKIYEEKDYWTMTIELTTNAIKIKTVIVEPYLYTYETWIKLATSDDNTDDFIALRLEDGYYTIFGERKGEGHDTFTEIKIERNNLAGPLLEAIEDARKRGLEFA